MVSVWWSQGQAVSVGAIGPLMLGSLAVPTYAVTFAFYQPQFGTIVGALLSYITAVLLISLPCMFILRKCQVCVKIYFPSSYCKARAPHPVQEVQELNLLAETDQEEQPDGPLQTEQNDVE